MAQVSPIAKFYDLIAKVTSYLQSPLLLLMRLYWGYSFFQAGKGKLMNLDRVTEFFASINIPMAKANAMFVGSVEMIGGILLILGLASRLISIPLSITMIVAFLTAHKEELTIFSDSSKFTAAAPFSYLLVCLIIVAFGPGLVSLDALISKKFGGDADGKESRDKLGY